MDTEALPRSHVLKPLENRLLAMCGDTHPAMRVLMGNAVAALRAFSRDHPTIHESGDCWEVFEGTDGATGGCYRGTRQRYPHKEDE